MQVNSLLERMRKVRQEKAAAAAAAAATATATAAAPPAVTNATATVPAANAASRDAPVPSAADADTAGGGGVVSSSFLTGVTVPAPPPVFASPSSARLEYRDNAKDALCVPFTCDMVVPVLNALLSDHQRGSTSTVAAAASGGLNGAVVPMMTEAVDTMDATGGDARDVSTLSSASAEIPSAGRDSSGKESQPIVVAKAVMHMQEVLAAQGPPQMSQKTTLESVPSITTTGTATAASASVSSLRLSSASLFADAAYNTACAVARVDVSGAVRPICRDVNYYTRVGRISQGVYGVVFRAVTTADYERQHRQQSRHRVTRPGSAASSAAAPSAHVRTYALKHIKKMWLEDSQVGLPPYLMREIDLLLRLQHPNIMGALELVLLDPMPVPRRLASPPESCSPSSSSSESPSSSSSESPSTEQHAEEATECDRALRRLRSTMEDTARQNLAKKARIDNAEEPPLPREEARPATQVQTTGEKGTAQDAAATRPLAAVGAASKAKDVFLVMDYCPYDLGSYMRRYATAAEVHGDGGGCKSNHASAQMPYFHITPRNAHPQAAASYVARAKSIVYQILRAVAFLHDSRILHRDLKTSNVLLGEDGYVKVCDFGLGRLYREGQALTPTVVTLMYRAPELHFGVVDYSHKMDVWSVGCIFAELFLRRPLFHASTDSHHLLAVCEVLGIPTEESFPGLYHLPQTKTMMQSLPRWNRTSRLASLFQRGAVLPTVAHGDIPVAAEGALLPESGVDLLASVLQWNPRRRPSAAEALQHPFFKEEPLPCAPAELMRPMPWMDAAAAAGNAMPSSALGREDRRDQPGGRGSQDGLSTATQMAPSTTGRPSSESVPPTMQHVADIPSGVEATVAAVSSSSEGATAASPLASASPDTFPGGSRSVVVSDTVGGRYQQAIGTRDYSGSDGDFAEEDEEEQRLQLHTRRSTRDQAEDDDDSDAETERVGRQARLLANQDRDE